MKRKVAIALGSNIGDAAGNIRAAYARLDEILDNARLSKLYASAPMYHVDQQIFVNAVAVGYSDIGLDILLNILKNIEEEQGRIATFRNGPRVIDLDIVLSGDEVFESEALIVPHPRMDERPFVLIPLADLEPDWVHPVTGLNIKNMIKVLVREEGDLHELAA